ncbi:MAG: UDP-N-acetylmuramoyl-L-alanine--D-glutamate ligase [Deltaproteobacteria bacterium]|nr:MAG: UDP-N-acetylmuramoyl-L-alanine--D-glutamate ligase [Deltaproteobacteria bacterium]
MTRTVPYGPPYDLKGRNVLVVGAGRSGRAAAELCLREGAAVTLTDRRADEHLDLDWAAGRPLTLHLGGHRLDDFLEADLIVPSPGVPRGISELRRAQEAGVPILGEVEIAASFLTAIPFVGVTGTNGKSTTTALLGAILEAAGQAPFVGGNLGRPLAEAVLESRPPKSLAVELSSYQLESTHHLRPDVAVLLNLAPDHLAWHGSFEAYGQAKAKLWQRQGPGDTLVTSADDPAALALAEGAASRLRTFSVEGRDADARGEQGLVVVGTRRYRIGGPALRGPHNLANAAAAILAAEALGVAPDAIQAGLDAFRGLPHRLEVVRERGGVSWIDDSKATNVESARTALRSFPGGIVWIAGGRGKGAAYAPLSGLVRERVRVLLAIGEEAPLLLRELGGAVEVAEAAGDLEAAVRRAAALARPGEVVLLSPACASFDQYESYVQRGMHFRRLVEALP